MRPQRPSFLALAGILLSLAAATTRAEDPPKSAVDEALAGEIIGPRQAMADVQAFTEALHPPDAGGPVGRRLDEAGRPLPLGGLLPRHLPRPGRGLA